jgi:hypothetical protein
MTQSRRRITQAKSFHERLLEEAAKCREAAEQLPPGTEREALTKRSQQAEAAAQMDDWLAPTNKSAAAPLRQLTRPHEKAHAS